VALATYPQLQALVLRGTHICLEPLEPKHSIGLSTAAAANPALYRWSPVPQEEEECVKYIETALAWRDAGAALPFAIIRKADSAVVGSTRFWNIEHWAWPAGHTIDGRAADACEIGYTWLTQSAIRTAANTESKLLMLTHAFENWHVVRVCFHTDVRNERSRAALEGIGAKFEGILRAHRMAADFTARDSARFSIIASEWPTVKHALVRRLARG